MGVLSLLKDKTVITVTVITMLITVAALYKKFIYADASSYSALYEIKAYQPISNGWGYRIYRKGTLFIQQEYIPAVAGMKRFSTKEQAEAAATLVRDKLLRGESPTVTSRELYQLGIE